MSYPRTHARALYALKIAERLARARPNAIVELDYQTPFQLLIATLLSAQCTDVRVNQITPGLFHRYPTPASLKSANVAELEMQIYSTGFYREKAARLIQCAAILDEDFGGEVPRTLADLTRLPGVGRKTANVLMGCLFGADAIVVDTHVIRLAQRLHLTRSDRPDRIEADLAALLPQSMWTETSRRLVLHGRYVCIARSPRCLDCPLFDLCPDEAHKQKAVLASAPAKAGRHR